MVAITEERSLSSTTPEIIYPSSDGEPLAETQQHASAILNTFGLLRLYLQNQQAVVFADQFLYYIEGNPKARVAPDVMVVFDINKKLYDNYKIWEWKQNPAMIIEVTSAGTKDTDFNFKKMLYEQLGVTEYWLFDPYGEWITEQLRGYRLNAAEIYEPITDHCSQVLQLRLEADEYLISFYRLDNGEKLRTLEELELAIQAAEQRAEQESQRAEQESQRANRLAEKLRQLGVELDE
ncbi:Uma2 family endonuclease [Pseudanabaena minima]|uniref:Uma2 family endonuclease n=1 Tax=Pseudanabaena minima TaxID=890415 RepID=UPI003DA99279